MTIRIKPVLSDREWEQFLLTVSPQSLFQSWLWGDVQKKMGSSVWRFGFYEASRLLGIMSVYKVVAKRGTYLHVRHGPVLREQRKVYWHHILDSLCSLAKKEKAWFVRVSPLIEDSEANRKLFFDLGMKKAPIHSLDAQRCWVLDLTPDEEAILGSMRKSTRYEIRRAAQMGVSVEKSNRAERLADFFSLYEKTAKRHGFVPHKGIAEEFSLFAKRNKAILLTARYNKSVLAAAIVLFYGNQAIYHHGASLLSKIPASYAVQWEAIREAKIRNLAVYNFWGVAPNGVPNHPWSGITAFKKGFSGREVNYLPAHDIPISPLYAFSYFVERIQKKLRGYHD